MPNYKTNLWTGVGGLQLTGVFPNCTAGASAIEFDSNDMGAGGLHGLTAASEARDDSRRFLWGVLEQFYTAYTGGRNNLIPASAGASSEASYNTSANATGSGAGKTAKMTVSKSSLSLIDEDTAKTTYTVVFNYAVGTPGGDTLEVEAE
jgi:hypothetical protein